MANDAAVGKNGSALTSDDRAQWQEWTKGYGHWRNQIFIVFWITYGAFYLCRVNFSVAIPDMMKEFGWSRSALGAVGTCLFWAYAVGQFTHGQISERFSSKHYLFTMMLLSALMNLLMIPAAGMGIAALGVVWALNGFFQAGGWPNCVKTLSQWFPPKARGKRMGLYGACYQFGNVMAWLLAGWAISQGGWRGAFTYAPLIFAAIAFIPLLMAKNRPEDANLPPIEVFEQHGEFAGMSVEEIRAKIKPKKEKEEHAGFKFTLKQTVGNPRIWAVSWSFFFVDVIRYGFLLWAPSYLFEVQKAGIEKAVYTAVAVPAFGIAGAIFSGWASDHWFQSRRPPIACILMGALGCPLDLFLLRRAAGRVAAELRNPRADRLLRPGDPGHPDRGRTHGLRHAQGRRVGRRVHRFLRLHRRRHGREFSAATSPTISAGRPRSGSGSSRPSCPRPSWPFSGNTNPNPENISKPTREPDQKGEARFPLLSCAGSVILTGWRR